MTWNSYQFLRKPLTKRGQLSFRKVAKNFGQSAFLSAREIEHGRFRALFAGWFCSKMQNGRILLKSKKKHSAASPQPKSKNISPQRTRRTQRRKRAGEKVVGATITNGRSL